MEDTRNTVAAQLAAELARGWRFRWFEFHRRRVVTSCGTQFRPAGRRLLLRCLSLAGRIFGPDFRFLRAADDVRFLRADLRYMKMLKQSLLFSCVMFVVTKGCFGSAALHCSP